MRATMSESTLGARLKRARLSYHHQSQRDADRHAGVQRGTHNQVESGKRRSLKIETIAALCSYYKVSSDWLLLGVGRCL
jgi:transcriptional regulator with XRE-family HTH domain